MTRTVVITQSNYIPWKGYFDLIASADEVILFDDMQYTRRDWRNRNRIKTPQGLQWLTVPVQVKGNYTQPIRETVIDGSLWQERHWKSLQQNYGKAPHFAEIAAWLSPLYLQQKHTHLSALNRCFLEAICSYLGIGTKLTNSWDYNLVPGKTERLVALCQQAGATHYLSSPAARAYLDEGLFAQAGIAVQWFDYDGYPEYPQGWGEFTHHVSVLDLLLHCGKDARSFMKVPA